MSANNDDSDAVNGRLRPRKPSIALPSPTRSKSLRRSLKNERNLEKSVFKPDPPSNLEFLCPYCDKKFASKKSASKHVSSSHLNDAGDVACQFCSHVGSEPLQLMRHMLDAHSDDYFACLDCRTRFTSSNELKAHKVNLCRKLKQPGKSYPYSQSKEKNETKNTIGNKDCQQGLEDEARFKGIVIACELKPTQIDDPSDIESNITTNLILPTNNSIVNSSTMAGKGPVLVIDDVQWNKRMAHNFSFHNSEADQILSRLGVVHRSPGAGAAAAIPRSQTYKYIEETTKFEKCFDTVFYSKVASNVQENLEKFLDGSFNRTPLDPDSIIKTRKTKNIINTAEGFPILLSSEQFSRTAFGAHLPRAIAPRHKWKRDSIENEKHSISADQLIRDSHANNCIVSLVSSLDIWTQICMRRKFEDKYNNMTFNERKTEKQNVISNELKEILESRELPPRAVSDEKCDKVATRQVQGVEFPISLGLRATLSPQLKTPPPALLSGEWVRPRCFVCCACGEYTRDPKVLIAHFNAHHPTANVSHYDIAGELLCNNDSIIKHLYVPSNIALNRTRPPRGIRDCTKCGKSISLEELHQHMLECAGDTPVVKRKCRYRPFGVRRRRPRMPDNAMRKKIRRTMVKRKTMQKNKICSHSTVRSEVGDAETIRKMIADLPAKRHRAADGSVATAQHRNRKRDITLNKLLRNRATLDNGNKIEKQYTQKDPKNSMKRDPKVKKKSNGNTSKNVQPNSLTSRPVRVPSRILRKADLKRKHVLRRSPRSATHSIGTHNDKQNPNKSSVFISSAVQTDELSLQASSDGVDVNRSRGRTSEHAARTNSSSSRPSQSERAGDSTANTNTSNNNNNHNQQESRPLIKHSIARLTATTETHDKAVQFQPHFLVNQECSKSSKPYLLSEPQVFYENDIVAARLDKPPLINYNQQSPVDPYAFQKSKLNKPRKKLNDCIAMLKNKLEEPPPPLDRYSMHETVHDELSAMPLSYASLEMMTPLNMIPDAQYDVPNSIPYAHINSSGPLDLSGKRSINNELLRTEYETLDLSQKNFNNSQKNYAYQISDEDVVVDLCTKSDHVSTYEESLDLSKRSKQFDERPISIMQRTCESHPIKPPPLYNYDVNAYQCYNNYNIHQTTNSRYPQQALDYNIENRTMYQSITSGYSRDLEYERITESNILTMNMISPNVDKTLARQRIAERTKKEREYNTSAQSTALVNSARSKGDKVDVATTTLEKNNKKNKLESETAVDETAKKIALLPKEIVEILGKMPSDHRNQLLDVLPQYLGCNSSVKQLKLVVDIHPEAIMSPMTTLKTASTEIATQTLTSSANQVENVIDIEKRSIESTKEYVQKNTSLMENVCVNTQGSHVNTRRPRVNNQGTHVNTYDLQVNTHGPHEITQGTNVYTQDPHVNTQRTRISSNGSHVNTQSSRVSDQSTNVNTQDLRLNTQDPRLNTQDPRVNHQGTHVNTQDTHANTLLTDNIHVNTQGLRANTKDLHLNTQRPHVNTQESHANPQGTRLNAQDQHTNSQRPPVNTRDLHANSQGLRVNTRDPHANSQGPRVNTQDPHAFAPSPRVNIQDSHSNTQGPHANTQGPRLNTKDLHLNNKGPLVNTHDSHAYTQRPRVNTQGPHANTQDSPANSKSPRVNTTKDPHAKIQGPHINTQDSHANTQGPHENIQDTSVNTQGTHVNTQGSHVINQSPLVNTQCSISNTQGPVISCGGINLRDTMSLQNYGLNKDILTGFTVDKPKEVKEKTASSLRAVRIKTSSQRRHTQSALEIKQTDHVPILCQPRLHTPEENVVIQQSEISSTEHNACSVNNSQGYPSDDTANLKRYSLNQSDSINSLETEKNMTASLSIVDVSACSAITPILEENEQNVKEAIDKDALSALPNKIINIEAPIVEVSDGDSEDDVSLAVIVKQRMAENHKTVIAKVKSDSPSRQRNARTTRKRSNDENYNDEIDPQKNNHTTTSSGMLDSVSKEKVSFAQKTDVNVNTNSVPETHSPYLGKKLRTRSIRKEEQPNGIEQRPIQNEPEAHSTFDIVKNKENDDQTSIEKHLLNSENFVIDNIPRDHINEQKDSEQPIAEVTQVSCQTLQVIEVIKPIEECLNAEYKSKKRIKEKKVDKPKIVEFPVKTVKTQVEPFDINVVKIISKNSTVSSESKETDVTKCLSSTTSTNVEKATATVSFNKPSDDDSESQSVSNSGDKAKSNRKLRRSRRGKSEINEIQATSQKNRDSPMISSVSNDLEFEDDGKSCSDSYVEQVDPEISLEKRLNENEINAKPNSKDILDNIQTKCEKEINIYKSSRSLRKKKLDTYEPPSLKSPKIDKPESKAQESKTSDLTENVSLIISTERENTDNISAEVKIMSPITRIPVCYLLSGDSPDNKDRNASLGHSEVIEKNKCMKQKKKSKSIGERKNKNQLSKKTTKSVVESSTDYPKLSENPNVFIVSDRSQSMSPSETKKSTTCYNISRASAVTRPSSSLSKSEDGKSVNYDPYDIDQDDNLLEKTPLKKPSSILKSCPEEMLPKKQEATVSNNFTYEETPKTTLTLSDSDDSSKSDVPLKKLADERAYRKNKLLKAAKSHKEEQAPVRVALNTTLSEDESLRSEQFMESFGFFSERRPRKSNIIAAKKIAETFQNDDSNERSSKTIDYSKSVSNIISADFPLKCSIYCTSKRNKSVRKRRPSKDLTFAYCSLCEKAFRRQDNYLRHIMSHFHLTKVLQKEMNYNIETIPEQPNCLIIYRQHIERIKRLTEKIKRKNKKLGITCSPPKFELPSLAEIMAEAKLHTYSGPGVARRGLSRDEALFLDCCELLKVSHKTEPVETVTLDSSVSPHRKLDNPNENTIAENRVDSKSDGDVDSITAKAILESDEVRNLEHDLLCGLKEAAEKRQLEINNQTHSPNSQSLDNFDLDLDNDPTRVDDTSVAENVFPPAVCEQVCAKLSSPERIDPCIEELVVVEKKPKKSKTKVTTEIAFDIYEDKFDKIKRKCRSQAAAAKVPPPLTKPSTSSKTKKKSDTKKNKNTPKNVKQNTIPTKGALKGFESTKLSGSVDNASSSEPGYEPTPPLKRKKSSHGNKRERKESFKSNTKTHCSNVLPRTRADIYEFLDNDDSDALQFRGSPTKDKFKTFKDTPSTSKADPLPQGYESSASDVDDFVYMSDDYLCSADETENSLLSSEPISNCKTTDGKKPSQRKEVLEKNTVMGKIFKNNAVRNERKPSISKETTNASKANLDQLFDSLLEDEPNSSMLKEDTDFPSNNRALSPAVAVVDAFAATTESKSCSDSLLNSPQRDQTIKRKKSRENKKDKQKRSKLYSEGSLKGTSYKKVKKRLSGEEKVSTEDVYGVGTSYKKVKKMLSGEEQVSTEDVYGVGTSYKKVKKSLSGEEKVSTDDGYGVGISCKNVKKSLSGEEKVSTDDGYGVGTSCKKVKKRFSEEEKLSTEDAYGAGTSHKKVKKTLSGEEKVSTEDGCGVAQHRARRACAVGKQNVLAETWSSESESDSPRATAAEAAAHSRKKRSKKNKHSASRQSKHVSFEKYENESDGDPSTKSFEKRNGGESRGRSRSQVAYVYSSEEGEDEHPEQHGWIVCNSHKKLVTLLAHAKGRKRDDKRSYID